MVKKILSIRKRQDFLNLRIKGSKFSSKYFIIYHQKKNQDKLTVGITVSKKHGNAVTRNRIKRLIRAIFIKHIGTVPCSMEIEVIPKKRPDKYKFKSLEEDFLKVLPNLR